MKFSLALAALVFACCLTGCVTYETVRPAVTGRVISAESKAPIPEAFLAFTSHDTLHFTDSSGHFDIPSRYGWHFYPLVFPVDYFPHETLTVQKKGYQTRAIPISGACRQRGLVIELRHVVPAP